MGIEVEEGVCWGVEMRVERESRLEGEEDEEVR